MTADIDPLSILATLGVASTSYQYPDLGEILLVVAGIIFFLLLNAFFVASEFAIVKVRKSQLESDTATHPKNKGAINRAITIVDQLDSYLSANQIGITVASLALGFLGEPLVSKLLAPTLVRLGMENATMISIISVISAYAAFTFFHVVLGELIPKSIAIRYPLESTVRASRTLHAFYTVFKWCGIIAVFNGTANFILKHLFKIDATGAHHAVHSAEELAFLVTESEKSLEVTETEAEISKNALELNDMCVKDILTPRGEVVSLDLADSFEANWEVVKTATHSRFPLVDGHLDEPRGWIHVKDLLRIVGQGKPDLMSIRRELRVVPETMALDTLLQFFLKEHAHFALVVDEFGDSQGLVFLDDILEQIVGDDIQDEFDQDEAKEFVKISMDTYIVQGGISLVDLADELEDLELVTPGVTTLSGYIVSELDQIPEEGVEILLKGTGTYRAKITGSDGRKITQVRLVREPVVET